MENVTRRSEISKETRLSQFFDVMGGFYQVRLPDESEWRRKPIQYTVRAAVEEQLGGKWVLNCHQRSRPMLTRSATIDIDLKFDSKKTPEIVADQVEKIVGKARSAGLEPWVVSSTWGKGRHIHFRWRDEQRIWGVQSLLHEIVVKAGFQVRSRDIEIFPAWEPTSTHGTTIAAPFARLSQDLMPTQSWEESKPIPLEYCLDEPSPTANQDEVQVDPESAVAIAHAALQIIPPPDSVAGDGAYDERIRMFLALRQATQNDETTLADFQEWVAKGAVGWKKWDDWERVSAKKWKSRRKGLLGLNYVIAQARKVDPSFMRDEGGRIGSEAWLVEQAAEGLRGVLIYVREDRDWAILEGFRWRRGAGPEARREIHRMNLRAVPRLWEAIGKADAKEEKSRLGHAIRHIETNKAAGEVATLLRADLIDSKWIFDRDPDVMCFRNGYLDMAQGKLIGTPQPGRFFSRQVPRDFLATADMSGWEKHLKTLLVTDGAISAFRALCGYFMLGRNSAKIFVVLIGPPDGGKSTTMEIISDVLGSDYVQTAKDRLFQVQRQSADADTSHDANMMSLMGARLILIPEPPPTHRWNLAKINRWTGGDGIAVRKAYGDQTETFHPPGILVALCNVMPGADTLSEAFWSRVRMISFPNRQKRDVHYRERFLRDNSAGVARWLAEAGIEFLEKVRKGENPLDVLEAQSQEEVKRERWKDDPLAMVLLSEVVKKPGATLTVAEVKKRAEKINPVKYNMLYASPRAVGSAFERFGFQTVEERKKVGGKEVKTTRVTNAAWLEPPSE